MPTYFVSGQFMYWSEGVGSYRKVVETDFEVKSDDDLRKLEQIVTKHYNDNPVSGRTYQYVIITNISKLDK